MKTGTTVVVPGMIVVAEENIMKLTEKITLLEEFKKSAEEGYPKMKELFARRDKLSSKFHAEFDSISQEILELSEKHGLPFGDSEGYCSEREWSGQWAYIPDSFVKYVPLGEDAVDVIVAHDDLDHLAEYIFEESMSNLAFGEWVGSSC